MFFLYLIGYEKSLLHLGRMQSLFLPSAIQLAHSKGELSINNGEALETGVIGFILQKKFSKDPLSSKEVAFLTRSLLGRSCLTWRNPLILCILIPLSIYCLVYSYIFIGPCLLMNRCIPTGSNEPGSWRWAFYHKTKRWGDNIVIHM